MFCGHQLKQVITEEEFINLGDGRRLCRNCYSISMKDAEDCKLLFHLVRKFFGLFDLKLDERPILLTDEYEIMRLRGLKVRNFNLGIVMLIKRFFFFFLYFIYISISFWFFFFVFKFVSYLSIGKGQRCICK